MRQERLLDKQEFIKWIFSKHRNQEDNKYFDLSKLKQIMNYIMLIKRKKNITGLLN